LRRCWVRVWGYRGWGMRESKEEDLPGWVARVSGGWDQTLYRRMLGAANAFKEGDAIVGVAAPDDATRHLSRQLLAATPLAAIDAHPPFTDDLHQFISASVDSALQSRLAPMTLGALRTFLLERTEAEVHAIRDGLSSDVIACVVRLMSNEELTRVGAKVFNPLPGSRVGAKGYLGARIQPNSPTDDLDDIRWQLFDAFAYGVGDVLVGTNPVSSTPESVAAVEGALQEVLVTFGIADVLPHCVLSHIDVQAEVERAHPGRTALWFQSLGGNDAANATFGLSVAGMVAHAQARPGRFGLYFETGQGADFTNGHGHGTDMVVHESRKYGFARALARTVAATRGDAGPPWVHVNDVAGFIGPEVFRTREQLVRCCLEDIVMGKLHGLMIGLDVCATLHMDVSLDDLTWCLDEVMPANPGYLMALPTRIDPMLAYLTTSYQDHVRIRERYDYRVDDRMWAFFQSLGILDAAGRPTVHFGDPVWVYLQYCRRRADARPEQEIRAEAEARMAEVRARGVFLAEGHGERPSAMAPALAARVQHIYDDAKLAIWQELTDAFVATVPDAMRLRTASVDRTDYILHPASGEVLSAESVAQVRALRDRYPEATVQLVISDGLNALALMEQDQLLRLLTRLRAELAASGVQLSPTNLVVDAGRVRAGYRIGEALFGGRADRCAILHIVGERPGTGHHSLSVYMTVADGRTWGTPDAVDHDITRVVSGISLTTLAPEDAAVEAARLFRQL